MSKEKETKTAEETEAMTPNVETASTAKETAEAAAEETTTEETTDTSIADESSVEEVVAEEHTEEPVVEEELSKEAVPEEATEEFNWEDYAEGGLATYTSEESLSRRQCRLLNTRSTRCSQ